MPEGRFNADTTAIRERARRKMEEGISRPQVACEFTEHAQSERGHDDLVDLLGA